MSPDPAIPPEDPAPSLPPEDPAAESEEVLQELQFDIRHDLQKRVDLYLRDRLANYSRAMLQKLCRAGNVLVNGHVAKSSTLIRAGDTVKVTLPHAPPEEALPENIPLDIIYEDDQFIALNKQPGLIVHPARGHWTGTLINALLYHSQQTHGTLSTGSDPWRPGIIHRLDRDTTGLILVAKTDEAHWRLAGQFERRTIKKTYIALVHGIIDLDSDLIDAPLAVHPKVREKYAVRPDIGKPAQTVYTVLERFPWHRRPADGPVNRRLSQHSALSTQNSRAGYSLLELAPKTGRTHQLRVHLAHIGHPIVGDSTYGGRQITPADIPLVTRASSPPVDEAAESQPSKIKNQKSKMAGDETPDQPLIQRQALHAFRLQFVHPTKFHRMTLEAPLPQDISHLLNLLRTTC